MHILPIPTRLLKSGDDLPKILRETNLLKSNDILVISSKAVATCEGAAIDLSKMNVTEEAKALAKKCNQDETFTQAVLEETKRLNGEVIGTSPYALLTSLRPTGSKKGRILCPNAGLDRSNIQKGFAIGWPKECVKSVQNLYSSLKLPIILSDSCCRPGRLGVTAFALVCAGIGPLKSEVGHKDLFGLSLRVTQEAVADQLATAANAVMGNAGQSVPAAIIRDHGFPKSNFCGWVDGIEEDDDLFRGAFSSPATL